MTQIVKNALANRNCWSILQKLPGFLHLCRFHDPDADEQGYVVSVYSWTSWSLFWNVSVSSRSWRYNVSVLVSWLYVMWSCEHPCTASGLRIYQEENNGPDLQETGCQVTDFTIVFLNCDTAVSRGFLERLIGLVSVLKVVSVLRVWKNGTSRSRLVGWPSISVSSRSCGVECGHPCRSILPCPHVHLYKCSKSKIFLFVCLRGIVCRRKCKPRV